MTNLTCCHETCLQCLMHRSLQEQSSAHQHSPLAVKAVVLIFWFQNTVLHQKRSNALAVDYTRLGIDLLLKQYSFHSVKEARLQYQGCDCNPWACNLIFKMFKLGKFEAQEIVLLMLCEIQRDWLASDFNCSKFFGTEKKPFNPTLGL